jgi:WD40 repeat protein
MVWKGGFKSSLACPIEYRSRPVSGNGDNLPEQQFDSWLIAYHDALAAGSAATSRPDFKPTPELLPRLQGAQACLQLLERVWPRSAQLTPEDNGERPPAGLSFAHDLPVRINRFQIRRELGRGGFGIVFLAWDPKLGREVALKVPRGEVLLDVELRRRFIWEAQAAAGLSHPHIVHVHEAGLAGTVLYIASEYCSGTTLADWLARRQQPVSARSAATLVALLAGTVHYIHSQGILHRDLKPRNILLTLPPKGPTKDLDGLSTELEDFIPKVTDFGLAKALERGGDDTRTGTVVGTVRYMAPEQVRGRSKEIGWYADVYALGVILYELLTGRTPFRANGEQDTREQVLSQEPPPSLHRLAKVPHDLETICLKCLRKEPKERYPSAQALSDDLRRYLNGEPIQARATSPLERVVKWVRRRPAAAVLTVTAAIGVPVICLVVGQAVMERRITERIAEANKYHALVSKAAEHVANAPLGWKQQSLRYIEQAAHLATEARDSMQLRNLAVRSLAGIDFQQVAVLARGCNPFCVAFSPDGKRLAIGEYHGLGMVRVLVFDTASRQLLWELVSPADPADILKTGIRSLTFGPDQRWLAAGNRKGELLVWDLSQPTPVRHTWQGHDGTIGGLVFSPDGQFLFSSSEDKHLKVWDAGTWTRQIASEAFEYGLEEVALSPDGKVLACGSDHWVRLLDAQTLVSGSKRAKVLAQLPGHHARLAFHPGGQMLAVSNGLSLWLLNYDEGTLTFVRKLPSEDVKAHDQEINHLSFSLDGALLVSGGGDRKLMIWELASGRLISTIPVEGEGNVYPLFSPGGRLLAATSDNKTILLELLGLEEQAVIAVCARPSRAIAFGPGSSRLACITDHRLLGEEFPFPGDERTVKIMVWQPAQATPLNAYPIPGRLVSVHRMPPALAYHPREDALAFSGNEAVDLHAWDLVSQKNSIVPQSVEITALSFDRDGKSLWGVVDDPRGPDQVVCWSWPDLATVSQWRNITSKSVRIRIGLLCICAGRQWVLAGSADTYTKLLSTGDGSRLITEWPSPGGHAVQSVALSPDETLAVSGTQVGRVSVVRIPSGEALGELTARDDSKAHRDSVDSLAFSPDGELLVSGSKDGTVRLWQHQADNFHEIVTLPMTGPVRQVAFTPDGKQLAVLVQNERAVRIWHLDRLNASLKKMDLAW